MSTKMELKKRLTPFKKLALNVQRALFSQLKSYIDKEISLLEFQSAIEAILFEGHSRASVIGRHIAGVRTPLSGEDRILASIILEQDKQFLMNFINDIQNGRYTLEDGAINPNPIKARLNLYAAKTRGTLHQSFVQVSPARSFFEWILIAEKNCRDCPSIAAGSPYTSQTLPTYPGSGNTQCLTNCRCVLMRDDGQITESYPYETTEELVESVI